MLQILRNKAQSVVIQAIVVIIALVFIFWGVGTNMMNSRESAIVVNDEEISFQDFQIAHDRTYNRMREQFGGNVPQALLENLGLKDQVANQLIQEALLRQGAAEMGVQVSKEDIQSTIEEMVQFQENGKFNIEKYKSILVANGYSPNSFEESVQFDMLAQKVRSDISNFAAMTTDYEIEDLHRLEKSTVAINFAVISPDDYADAIEANDEELQQWYSTVEDNYTTDPQVKLKYLDFSYSTVGQKITIDDDSAEKYYNENLADFTQSEKRGARHILFKVDENTPPEVHEQQEQKAREVLEIAKKGGDFSALAKQYSEGPSKEQGGDLGLFPRGQMVKPFDDVVFSQDIDSISDVVKTQFGYHIIKLEKIVPKQTKLFAEVKDSIMKKLQLEQAKPLAFQVANEAYEEIIGAGSLANHLEAKPDTEVKETDFFSRQTPPAEVGNDQKFITAAFSLKEKELSSLIETSSGYAILFAEAVKPPGVPELNKIKEKVASDYRKNKASEKAKETAQEILRKAKEESSLNTVAEKDGFSVQESGNLSKTDMGKATLPKNIIEGAFKLTTKNRFPEEPLESANKFYIFEFKERKEPTTELSKEDRDRYKNAIIQLKQQQVLSGWLKNRRQQSKVYTHKNL